MTHKLLTFSLAACFVCAGPWITALASAQCSTDPSDINYSPECAANQCDPQSGSCSTTKMTTGPNETQTAPAGEPAGLIPLQVPNLMPQLGPGSSGTTPNAVSAARNAIGTPPATARPPMVRSEFELLAEDAAGQPLPVYGRQLFSQVPSTFAPIDRVPVPADYVLGPGDQLLIRVWGKIELQSAVTIDRNGQVFLPRIGTFSVAGLRYEQIEGVLRSAIGNLYKDFEINVTMGQLRSIQVFVLGSARQPGVYTVGSLSTLVNALFASGGPSASGTMRHIQLRRDNRLVTELDMYDLLRNGDKSHDAQLLPGDVIYIPPVGPQIAIMGAVHEPGIYELARETTIAGALQDAGGLSNLADTDRVLLERIENHRRRSVDDFPLDQPGLGRVLADGDMLRVFPISPKVDNAVTLRGSVAQPGRFQWHEGMRVSDLIPSRDALITRHYWNQETHLVPPSTARTNWDLRSRWGEPFAATGSQNRQYPPAGSSAAQRSQDQQINPEAGPGGNNDLYQRSGPGNSQDSYQRSGPGNSQDLYQRSNLFDNPPLDMTTDLTQRTAEVNWEYAAIERLDKRDLSTQVIAFNLGKALDDPASTDNKVLQPGDVVTIFSRRDLPLPEDKHAAFVKVAGEVNAPGVYRISPGETLRDIVKQAGGLTAHSYLYGSLFTRVSTRHAQELEIRQSTAQMRRELLSKNAAVSAAGTTAADQQAQLSMQQALIAQLASVQPTGRIVLTLKPSANSVEDIPAFPLEDGDAFYVPPMMNTVEVSGAVYNENAFRYERRKRLAAYLSDAGGPTRQADTRRIFLIRADGTVISRQTRGSFWHENFENRTLLPGDAIIVPTKMKSPSGFSQQWPFLASQLSNVALTGAMIGTIY